jgi:hypothetical protein
MLAIEIDQTDRYVFYGVALNLDKVNNAPDNSLQCRFLTISLLCLEGR